MIAPHDAARVARSERGFADGPHRIEAFSAHEPRIARGSRRAAVAPVGAVLATYAVATELTCAGRRTHGIVAHSADRNDLMASPLRVACEAVVARGTREATATARCSIGDAARGADAPARPARGASDTLRTLVADLSDRDAGNACPERVARGAVGARPTDAGGAERSDATTGRGTFDALHAHRPGRALPRAHRRAGLSFGGQRHAAGRARGGADQPGIAGAVHATRAVERARPEAPPHIVARRAALLSLGTDRVWCAPTQRVRARPRSDAARPRGERRPATRSPTVVVVRAPQACAAVALGRARGSKAPVRHDRDASPGETDVTAPARADSARVALAPERDHRQAPPRVTQRRSAQTSKPRVARSARSSTGGVRAPIRHAAQTVATAAGGPARADVGDLCPVAYLALGDLIGNLIEAHPLQRAVRRDDNRQRHARPHHVARHEW